MPSLLAYLCPLSVLLLCSAAFIASAWGFQGRGLTVAGYLLLAAILAAAVFLATVDVQVFPAQH